MFHKLPVWIGTAPIAPAPGSINQYTRNAERLSFLALLLTRKGNAAILARHGEELRALARAGLSLERLRKLVKDVDLQRASWFLNAIGTDEPSFIWASTVRPLKELWDEIEGEKLLGRGGVNAVMPGVYDFVKFLEEYGA